MRLALTLEYDGSGFAGWARQPGQRSVEEALRNALELTFSHWGEIAVAGRTDAGVHALGQVVSVDVLGGPPLERIARALNTRLPPDVKVVHAQQASGRFDARYDARARSYRYRILRRSSPSPFEVRRSWWVPGCLDEEALKVAAAAVVGEHDFRAFTPADTHHRRFVRCVRSCSWERVGDMLVLEITADSFLRHMVRTLVGTMVAGDVHSLPQLLGGRPRSEGGPTAPPWGLYLVSVEYEVAAP